MCRLCSPTCCPTPADPRPTQVEGISSAMPSWVANVGDRRRVERAWLAWRLAVAQGAQEAAAALGQQLEQQQAVLSQQQEDLLRERQQQQQQQALQLEAQRGAPSEGGAPPAPRSTRST